MVITPDRSTVVVARGPRAAEAELLRLAREYAPRSADQLGSPLRIVVPSASLRQHVVARLAAGFGHGVAGVVVQTLSAAAQEVLERAGDGARPAGELTSILVRRRAASEAVLGPSLAGLDDGYGIVEGAVRDLLDAGFEPEHAAVLADKLRDLEGLLTPARLARVTGVAKVAAAVSLELDALGARRFEQLPQRAAELLRTTGPSALPSRAIVIHGFADATGVATDFIHALLAVVGGVIVLDRPPDPTRIERDDPGSAFLERFEAHLGAFPRVDATAEPASPGLEIFSAPTAEAEARQAAHRVRALLDRAVPPEGIGVVFRTLEREAAAFRRHFDRLGIPCSGSEAALPGGLAWRRARLLSEILRLGSELPAELWLEALDRHPTSSHVGLAMRTLGVISLADAAGLASTLDPDRAIRLPFPDVDDGEARRGRKIEASEVLRVADRATVLVETLSSWPERGFATDHMAHLERVMDGLGWQRDTPAADPVFGAIDRLACELPAGFDLGRGEVLEAARRRLAEVGLEAVGGAGGGVQVLSAMEARGRTFDHLFLVAVNRGRFPRVVREDPLLPDTVRGHLAAEVLPEFPVKARGLDEERYLFAQLVGSAEHVVLSWRTTEDGSRAAPSPFVERLRREIGLGVERCSAALGEAKKLAPLSAFEHAVLAAELSDRIGLIPALAEAVAEGGGRAGVEMTGSEEWAAARIDVLDAIDPVRPGEGLGPWAGLVGDTVIRPGGALPAVTGLEDVGRCPWRAFVGRRLGVSEMPDPRLGLPDTRGLLLGSTVHLVLQRVVEEAVGPSRLPLEELVGAVGRDVPWPGPARLDAWTTTAAEAVIARNGLEGTGVAPLLAAQVRRVLDVARAMDWPEGSARNVVAAEVSGDVNVANVATVRFRADRLDRDGDTFVLVDYKSGKPPSSAKKEDTRRKHLLQEVAMGRSLQAVAYALGTPAPLHGVGRYLALKPEIGDAPEEARRTSVTSDDDEMAAAFNHAVATIVSGLSAGGLPPRVEEAHRPGKTPPACAYCPVAQACLRVDPGYRQRIVSWMAGAGGSRSEVVDSARDLWWLGVVDRSDGGAT